MHRYVTYARRAMMAGASGFVVKDSPADRLARTIRQVLSGQRVIDPELAAAGEPAHALLSAVRRLAFARGTDHRGNAGQLPL